MHPNMETAFEAILLALQRLEEGGAFRAISEGEAIPDGVSVQWYGTNPPEGYLFSSDGEPVDVRRCVQSVIYLKQGVQKARLALAYDGSFSIF